MTELYKEVRMCVCGHNKATHMTCNCPTCKEGRHGCMEPDCPCIQYKYNDKAQQDREE